MFDVSLKYVNKSRVHTGNWDVSVSAKLKQYRVMIAIILQDEWNIEVAVNKTMFFVLVEITIWSNVFLKVKYI